MDGHLRDGRLTRRNLDAARVVLPGVRRSLKRHVLAVDVVGGRCESELEGERLRHLREVVAAVVGLRATSWRLVSHPSGRAGVKDAVSLLDHESEVGRLVRSQVDVGSVVRCLHRTEAKSVRARPIERSVAIVVLIEDDPDGSRLLAGATLTVQGATL